MRIALALAVSSLFARGFFIVTGLNLLTSAVIDILRGPTTGLPIPAYAEIAFEGFVHKDDLIGEGPLGEWTGYYAGGRADRPAIRIERLWYRNDPILTGVIPGIPPNDDTFYRGTARTDPAGSVPLRCATWGACRWTHTAPASASARRTRVSHKRRRESRRASRLMPRIQGSSPAGVHSS